ncbi:MAG TPA: alpha/beta fold hydrolase [Gemmataceae bacterium]|nr:alpha/beta fold hydrolase [Gemmataceae bacterium]
MLLFWLGLLLMCSVPLTLVSWLIGLHYYLRWKYLDYMVRIFQEKPLFVIPAGQPVSEAEDLSFTTADRLNLKGCYLKTRRPRKGVILFGVEFGSNRWSCVQYCQHLVDAGFDVFAFELRNQGESDHLAGYEPLQWVTDYEVEDMRAALRYLKARPDADPRGIGLFGISKGAGAGLLAAARDPFVRCFVTDGVFATYTVVVPYMRYWFKIYNSRYTIQGLLPSWYYGRVGLVGLHRIEKVRKCHFPHLERAIRRLAGRPLLMIHGEADTYIKPEMARALFEQAREPKEFWLVEGAKHNQAQQVAGAEYERRVREFFNRHLADPGANQDEPQARPA